MAGSSSAQTWLTPEAHERLRAELAGLLRAEAADSGPEDPDRYVEARHRRARIRHLRDLVHHAVVGEDPPDDGIAEPGMVLTVRYDDDGTTETFLLGLGDDAGSADLEVYSPHSPLGLALGGARRGERRSYRVPSGGTVRVTLLDAAPYGRHRERAAEFAEG
ncbi:GreA/GreB family elongation factor [Amycolatopsis australiensis]|uniref:Transcription elongation factor, GreA/GreB family n=1 Tax=Amycolatopsis australiensis TaxID=546364 RepID=A0A1K1SMC3_9PSEU|nr:GreA/GreB family elongation factor [Amycolatopsis australiensis]SFW85568.1 Transcription elongation factor, GreA/GreB family [Amycolatopsis australiensis]